MKRIISGMVLLSTALILGGCASVQTFRVDAISSGNSSPDAALTYAIVPADPQVSGSDLRFLECAACLEKGLAAKGYSRVDSSEKAVITVAVDASVSAPQNVPVVRDELVFSDWGLYRAGMVPVRGRDGGICFVHTRFWGPCRPGMFAMEGRVTSDTYYQKRLSVSAYGGTPDKDGNLSQLWSVVVESWDRDGDLRAAMPAMALAAARYAGEDTKGQVTVRLRSDDPDLKMMISAESAK